MSLNDRHVHMCVRAPIRSVIERVSLASNCERMSPVFAACRCVYVWFIRPSAPQHA